MNLLQRRERLTRREFLKIMALSAGGTFVTGGAVYYYGTRLEPENIEIKPVALTLPRLAPEFEGFRLVQISDIHFDDIVMTHDRLQHIVDLVAEQRPDAIAITGDYVTFAAKRFQDSLVSALSRLAGLATTITVLGNHDHWVNASLLREMFQATDVFEARNRIMTLERDGALLHLCGVDDFMEKHDDLERVLDRLPDEGAAILLVHEPDFADTSAKSGRFDLEISGHSHGGQVVIPLLGPPIVPVYGTKYHTGLYKVGSMYHYTTRGVGVVPPRIRLNCRPEVTVFTLHSPAS